MMPPIAHYPVMGILGGTFDPIHCGHLRTALVLQQQLNLTAVRFVPCQIPVLKPNAQASAQQRWAMLQLALADQPSFIADDRELQRTGPSYMVDTLLSLRHDLPDIALGLIIGSDVVQNLMQWHRWQDICTLAHLIIVQREAPPVALPAPLHAYLTERRITYPHQLSQNLAGSVLMVDLPILPISSSAIRTQLINQHSPRYLLPDAVLAYITQEKIYRN